MSSAFDFFRSSIAAPPREGLTELVQPQRALRRILSFTGRTIDDVINDPVARNQVRGYFKLHKWIDREVEIGELDRQWGLPRSASRGRV